MSTTGGPQSFQVGSLYSSEEIQAGLGVGNAGGVRLSVADDGSVRRAVILTSVPTARQLSENPYHDRIEDDILVYTGAGREGDQTLAGVNKRLPQQNAGNFPAYGFVLIGSRRDPKIGPKRWRFVGLLEYLRHYPDTQVDASGALRKVWLFEMRIHEAPSNITVTQDADISRYVLAESRATHRYSGDDQELGQTPGVVLPTEEQFDPAEIEAIRGQLLATAPARFEHLLKDLLVRSGFDRVTVTRFSQDGGIDVNAYAGRTMWPVQNLFVQLQAKRWLHTVGRKEVAELRGSLAPYARGAIVTTSHFSRAAITEATDLGKAPIVLVDGYETAKLVLDSGLTV
jgi:HJR/Mrr/RecB family endonuclease